jgi:hypothetical protein
LLVEADNSVLAREGVAMDMDDWTNGASQTAALTHIADRVEVTGTITLPTGVGEVLTQDFSALSTVALDHLRRQGDHPHRLRVRAAHPDQHAADHDRLWELMTGRPGSQGETRAMVTLIRMGREFGHAKLEASVAQAIEWDSTDVAANPSPAYDRATPACRSRNGLDRHADGLRTAAADPSLGQSPSVEEINVCRIEGRLAFSGISL